MKSEYEYILSACDQLGEHLGEWIAVIDEEIVSTGDDAKKVYQEAKEKYADKTPFIMKIPKETVMLL